MTEILRSSERTGACPAANALPRKHFNSAHFSRLTSYWAAMQVATTYIFQMKSHIWGWWMIGERLDVLPDCIRSARAQNWSPNPARTRDRLTRPGPTRAAQLNLEPEPDPKSPPPPITNKKKKGKILHFTIAERDRASERTRKVARACEHASARLSLQAMRLSYFKNSDFAASLQINIMLWLASQ